MAANPNDGDGFFPMTVIDTGHIRDPSEHIYGPGQYFNPTEARLVVQIIDHLLRICHPGRLDNEIAVIAPYARQVRHIQQERLNSEVIRTPQQRNQIGILVCTVDSMQGSEAAVVIFSATRSNQKGLVGFVKEAPRLNVSVSRAKYVNIILADFSTMNTRGKPSHCGISQLTKIYNWCRMNLAGRSRLANAYNKRLNPI